MTATHHRELSGAAVLAGAFSDDQSDLRDALALEDAGVRSWRVCDCRVSRGPGRFLAFIEEKDDQFEVMQFGEGFVWTSFITIDEALAHIVRTAEAFVAARLSAESAWTS